MLVPLQSVSKRCGRSVALTISAAVALGLVGLYNQMPPLQPMGVNPSGGGKPKRCPNPECGQPVNPDDYGRYACLVCHQKFIAAEAEDYAYEAEDYA